MNPDTRPGGDIGVAPLVGYAEDEETQWLGAMFGKLLTEHLAGAGLPTRSYNAVAQQIAVSRQALPLNAAGVDALRSALSLYALVHGRFARFDQDRMVGVQIIISAPGVSSAPLEVSFPASGFGQFIERLTLALIERLNVPIDDALRQRIRAVPRPASFEAFRQTAQARAAWARGENELALASASSALALDPSYEEAATIEAAIARTANDTVTAQEAFRRWARIAITRGHADAGAERLMLLGHWLRERGEWPQAQQAYEEARALYEQENDALGAARALDNLAGLDLLAGRVQNAIKSYRRTLRLFESSSQTQRDAAITLFNLSLAHKRLGQRDQASQALQQAYALAEMLKENGLLARCLALRGALHDDTGEWDRAANDYEQALRLFDVLGDEVGMAIVRAHQALLLKRQGSYPQAESLLVQALAVLQNQPDPHEKAVACLNLADLYFSMGQAEQAWPYIEQADAAFVRLGSAWREEAKELKQKLEEMLPGEQPATEARPSAAPDSGSAAGSSSTQPQQTGAEGLYNADISYDNEGTIDL
jgi:tetratricopeptide (TPR) repeat protein